MYILCIFNAGKNQYWLFSFKNRQLIPKWHNNRESQALLKEKMRDSESPLLNIEIQAWLIWIIKAYCEPLITGFKRSSAQAGRGMESLQKGGRGDSDKQNLKKRLPLWASAKYSKRLRKSTTEIPDVQMENPRTCEHLAPFPHHI